MTIEVSLSKMEALMAVNVGLMRHFSSLFAGRADKHGAREAWDLHIEGACGELAVAKVTGAYWDAAIDVFKRPDVGGLQVRTRSRHDYELIVRVNDRDSDRFVLVTGRCPRYVIRGFIVGADAKQQRWLKAHGDREEAYFVPHDALTPLTALRKVG